MSRILVSVDFVGQGEGASAHHSMLPASAIVPLLLFMVLLLSASLCGLAASGHFPAEHRATTLRSGLGSFILFGSLFVCLLCLVGGLVFIWRTVPWYAAVI